MMTFAEAFLVHCTFVKVPNLTYCFLRLTLPQTLSQVPLPQVFRVFYTS